MPIGRLVRVEPEHGQIEHAQRSQAQKGQAGAPQHVQRALAESGEETDGQQVEKPLEKPREAILGNAVPPAAMANLDLGDAKAPGMGQHRNEPVQLAVDADLAQDLAVDTA